MQSSHNPQVPRPTDSPPIPRISTWQLTSFRDHWCCRNTSLCTATLPEQSVRSPNLHLMSTLCLFSKKYLLNISLFIPYLLVFCVRSLLQRASWTPRAKLALHFPEHKKKSLRICTYGKEEDLAPSPDHRALWEKWKWVHGQLVSI